MNPVTRLVLVARDWGGERTAALAKCYVATLFFVFMSSSIAIPVVAQTPDATHPNARGLEQQQMIDSVRDAQARDASQKSRRRADILIGSAFASLLAAGLILQHWKIGGPHSSQAAFFGCAVLACLYVGNGLYFDFLFGETSSASRAGALVVAKEGSPMFWVIVVGKAAAMLVFLALGIKALRSGQRPSNER